MPILGYWAIRGLAQPIRLLLEFTATEFEDKKYVAGPPPDYDKSSWLDIKHSLGLDFPNLPYYIDGDVKITQSNAILRYIARKNDLCGKTEKEKVLVDIMENQAMDFRNGLVMLCYNPDFDKLVDDYKTNLVSKLQLFDKFLEGKKWFAGDTITFVDFVMYELLDQHKILAPEKVGQFQNLIAFLDHFEMLPKIKAYMNSDRFMKSPLNNPRSKFGNK